jgi:hypothetical protein
MAKRGAHEKFLRAPMDLTDDPEGFFRENVASGGHPWVTIKVEWGSVRAPSARSPVGLGSQFAGARCWLHCARARVPH